MWVMKLVFVCGFEALMVNCFNLSIWATQVRSLKDPLAAVLAVGVLLDLRFSLVLCFNLS